MLKVSLTILAKSAAVKEVFILLIVVVNFVVLVADLLDLIAERDLTLALQLQLVALYKLLQLLVLGLQTVFIRKLNV